MIFLTHLSFYTIPELSITIYINIDEHPTHRLMGNSKQRDARGRYRSADLTGPSHGSSGAESSQPWSGYDINARGRHWSAPLTGTYAKWIEDNLVPNYRSIKGVHERLDVLDSVELIHHSQKGRSGWPGLKRYAAADTGNPVQSSISRTFPVFTNYNKGKEWTGLSYSKNR